MVKNTGRYFQVRHCPYKFIAPHLKDLYDKKNKNVRDNLFSSKD